MDFVLIERIIVILINIIGVLLGIWVFKSSQKEALNRWFVIMALSVICWVNFSFIGSSTRIEEIAILFYKLNWAAVALFLVAFYYFFVPNFLEEKKEHKWLNYLIIAISSIFIYVSIFTDLVIKNVSERDWGFEIIFDYMNDAFSVYALFVAGVIIYHGIARYSKLKASERQKVKYFFFGIFIFILANIIFNVVGPFITKSTRWQHFGDYSSIVFLLFTGYAIAKHKLMDIRTAVARSVGFLFLLFSVAAFAGVLMWLLPVLVFSHETLDNPTYNILIRSVLGIILVFSFQPLKAWITKATDRIFFKNEYDSHELIKKITDTSHSTLMLIELLYKMVDLLIKEMKVSKGHFVLLDDGGTIHTTQAIGFQSSPDIKAADVKGLATHGILVLENLEDSSHFKKLLKKTDAAISVGLVDETGPIGALLLGEKNSGDMYSAKDIRVLGILATSISVAIQRAKEHEKVQNFNVYLQTEIARKTKELQEANDHLRELDAAKDEFISMASHQLRTPLTAIKGYLSMLIEGDAGEIKMAQFDFINEAFDGANRMVALINDLLNVSRMDTGRFFLEPVEIDLVSMVKQEVKQLEQAAKEKRLFLEFKTKNKNLKVKADETKIRQVIMNFIDNAVYYTPTGGITVTLESDSKNAIFKVTDTGMGVPESEKEKLFQKFFRAGNARKSRPDGTGLGIYLARKVIEDHGGEIIFESTEGKGSTFGFKLPIKSRIKKDITVPPADLATKVEGIGTGEEVHGDPDVGSVIFVSDKK